MKLLACENCKLDCIYAQITTSPKTSVKCDGMAIFAGSLNISISGYSGQGITNGHGQGTLQPTSRYVKIDGEAVVLENDEVTIQVTGNTSGGGTATVPVKVTITEAGQTSCLGE